MISRYRTPCARATVIAFLIVFADVATGAPVISLDPSFGSGGIVHAPTIAPVDAALQSDGKILVRGNNGSVTLTRFNRDGSIDTTFGVAGTIRPTLRGSPLTGNGNVALQPDGRILLAGGSLQPCTAGICGQANVARVLPDGTPDTSFGAGGFATLLGSDPQQGSIKVLVRSDGDIVTLIVSTTGGFLPMPAISLEILTSNGSHVVSPALPCLSTSFVPAVDISVQGDKVVALVNRSGEACITRFNPDGSLDGGFGTSGVAQGGNGTNMPTDPSDSSGRIMIQSFSDGNLGRLLSSGEPDLAFGDPQSNHTANIGKGALGFSCAGKLVVASVAEAGTPSASLQLARYNSNGTSDKSFNPDNPGEGVTLPIMGLNSPTRVLLRDDGALIVVGTADVGAPALASLSMVALLQSDCTQPDATVATVIEYYNASMDHYFMTSSLDDINALDSGHFIGWARTGYTFSSGSSGTLSPVCRFYIPPASGDSHFFSASASECAGVRTKFPQFVFETPEAMNLGLPDAVTGACAGPAALPVYRVWDKRSDTNHRYTTDRGVRDAMVAKGWVPEGYGPDSVAMCALVQ